MAAWRRRAAELFPELKNELSRPETTYYQFFFSLRCMLSNVCVAHETEAIDRIFQFARWCLDQEKRAPDLWNAAATAFYEHIFDSCRTPEYVIRHLSATDVARYWDLWEHFTPSEAWLEAEKHLRRAFPTAAR